MHEVTPGECTLCDRSCRYFIQNDFFCRLAGPVAPTGKAIVHWIGCINAIKKGIQINGFEYKIVQLADDTTIFVNDLKSLEVSINEFLEFEKMSGLK